MINHHRTELSFGSGDICIYMCGVPGCGKLVFRNQEPCEIGTFHRADPRKHALQLEGGDIIMSFSNAQSVDAVIRALKEIRTLAFEEQN